MAGIDYNATIAASQYPIALGVRSDGRQAYPGVKESDHEAHFPGNDPTGAGVGVSRGGGRVRRAPEGPGPFSASGRIDLISAGAPAAAPLSSVRSFVPEEMYNSLELIIAEDTPGLMTPGQRFSGALTRSDWDALDQAQVAVAHNSWFTADLPALFAGAGAPRTPVIGLAWGTFDLSKDGDDFYQGSYSLVIGGPFGGALAMDPSCDADPYLSAILSERLDRTVEARIMVVDLTDSGRFVSGPGKPSGAFRSIGDRGTVTVTAEGCLGSEVATFRVKGVR